CATNPQPPNNLVLLSLADFGPPCLPQGSAELCLLATGRLPANRYSIFNEGEILKFIKNVFGVPSLLALATVTAFGIGRSPNSSVTITSPSTLPSGVVSTFYSTSLSATGGTSPYTWAVKACSGACNTSLGFTSSGI